MKNNIKFISKIHTLLQNEWNSKPICFAIVGAHMYGFPSKDSDIDIRGVHVQNTFDLFKIHQRKDVIEKTFENMDFVSFELKKAFGLILKSNCNIVEDILTRQIEFSVYHKNLRELTLKALTKNIYKSYRGMAYYNYKKFITDTTDSYRFKSVKKYLYVLRALMAGIYVLETGNIEPNIINLNKVFKIDEVENLVKLKKAKSEWTKEEFDYKTIDKIIDDLFQRIDESYLNTNLPDNNKDILEEVDKFLIKVRKQEMR